MKMRKGIWRWEREYAEKGVDKKVSSICKTTGQFGHSRSKVSNFNTRRYFSKTENICRSIDRTPTRDFNQVQPNILDQNLLALTSPSDVETNISYIVNWTGNTDNFNLHWHEQVRNLKKRKEKERKLKPSASSGLNSWSIRASAYCTAAAPPTLKWSREPI